MTISTTRAVPFACTCRCFSISDHRCFSISDHLALRFPLHGMIETELLLSYACLLPQHSVSYSLKRELSNTMPVAHANITAMQFLQIRHSSNTFGNSFSQLQLKKMECSTVTTNRGVAGLYAVENQSPCNDKDALIKSW